MNEKARIITAGEEIQIAPYNRQFGSKKLGQRALTIFGPCNELHFSICYFVILGFVQGVPVDKPMVGKVMENSAAEQAGLKENDTIQAIDGKNTSTWKDVVTIVRENQIKKLRYK